MTSTISSGNVSPKFIMSVLINTNRMALSAQRHLTQNSRHLHRTIGQLSSGLRINSASDDAAGMAVRENMRAQRGGMAQASRNASEAVAMLQVAESGLASIGDIFTRMRELAVQAASDSLSDTERGFLNTEFQALDDEHDRISQATEYNGIRVLSGVEGDAFISDNGANAVPGYNAGSAFSRFTFQIGTRNDQNNQITVSIGSGSQADVDPATIATQADAQNAIDTMDTAIEINSLGRVRVGSPIRRLHAVIDHLAAATMNYDNAISQVADTDMAEATAYFSKQQVLQQAGVAMLAQANQQPNMVLRLLG